MKTGLNHLVRTVQATEASEWLRMRLELWPDANPGDLAEEIGQFLAHGPSPELPDLQAVFVCQRSEGGLCGLIEISIHSSAPGCETKHIGYIEAWYVDKEERSKGVGRALVEQAEIWAKKAGCLEMASDTTPSYPLSPGAHQALGYLEVARYFRKDLS
jgi:aminoglycoside 6'-N-acetyltransferase I